MEQMDDDAIHQYRERWEKKDTQDCVRSAWDILNLGITDAVHVCFWSSKEGNELQL